MKSNTFVSLNEKRYIIGTHDGIFSPDEVLACAIIALAFSEEYSVEIMRSSNIELLKKADMLINVTAIEQSKNCYLSSQSIWESFGKNVYSKLIKGNINNFEYSPSIEDFPFIYSFITPWNLLSTCNYDENFVAAVQATTLVLKSTILQEYASYEASINILYRISCDGNLPHEECYFSNGILQLANENQTWIESVIKYNLETKENFVDFVIFPDVTGWTAKCVPIALDSETPRVPFSKKLIGLDSAELSKLTNIKDVLYCKENGLSANAKTKDAIYSLCLKNMLMNF